MDEQDISRRALLKGASSAITGVTVLRIAGATEAWAQSDQEVIPWLDQPPPSPVPPGILGNQLVWEALDSWLTPASNFFHVSHYGQPDGLDASNWHVEIRGLVARTQSLAIADIKARERREVDFALECSGNTGLPFFIGGIGNARWAGTPLASLLEEAGVLEEAAEVVFWGADRGTVTIRDNSGIQGGGQTGMVEPGPGGNLNLTITEHFARSMPVRDAMNRANLLCYEMNGEPLPPEHGFPVRLIAPGWYGVANVKWLTRIELMDHRYAGRFMARDYVTIREEQRDGQTVWTFTTVSRQRLKSAPARVTRRNGRYAIMGAAWGALIAAVEVQIDRGPWMRTTLDSPARGRYSWSFWTFNWEAPSQGEHTIRSRAFDMNGNVQPTPDDPLLAARTTYWESNGQITRSVLIK